MSTACIVATVRQTVEFFLGRSTAWQRVATGVWLRGKVYGEGGYEDGGYRLNRSHRSPDGGVFPGEIHRLAAGGYGSVVTGEGLR
jgi:hypothetical protein